MFIQSWTSVVTTALIALGSWHALVQQPPSKQFGSWAEIKLLSSWSDTFVDVVVPGAVPNVSGTTRVPAKTISIRAGTQGFSIVAVSDPATRDTCFLRAAPILVSTQTGMYAMQLTLSNLNVWRSYFCAPSTATHGEALAAFVREVSEERVAVFPKTAGLVLALSAPPKFFLNGSQPVSADVQAVDFQDGRLRLRLKNYDGLVGTFWIDTETWKVTKTDFGGG